MQKRNLTGRKNKRWESICNNIEILHWHYSMVWWSLLFVFLHQPVPTSSNFSRTLFWTASANSCTQHLATRHIAWWIPFYHIWYNLGIKLSWLFLYSNELNRSIYGVYTYISRQYMKCIKASCLEFTKSICSNYLLNIVAQNKYWKLAIVEYYYRVLIIGFLIESVW